MNNWLVGQHGSGKSTLGVFFCVDKGVPVYLLASSPNQVDQKTGKPTFPKKFIRTTVDKLVHWVDDPLNPGKKKLMPCVKNCCILIDDNTDMRDKWKLYEPLLKEFRQFGLDIYATFHTYNHIPSQLVGYGTCLYCFRTNSRMPYSNVFAYPKKMEAARRYIQDKGDDHSFYKVDNTKGTVEVVLHWLEAA